MITYNMQNVWVELGCGSVWVLHSVMLMLYELK